MPVTYDYPFHLTKELEAEKLTVRRYRFAINSAVNDPWDSRFAISLNPSFKSNHPLQVAMLSPRVTSAASWLLSDGGNAHSNSAISAPSGLITPVGLPNPITSNLQAVFNPDNNATIGPLIANEQTGYDLLFYAGGMRLGMPNSRLDGFILSGMTTSVGGISAGTGSAQTFNILPMFSAYLLSLRTVGSSGNTFVTMISGENDNAAFGMNTGITYNEANYIAGTDPGVGQWNGDFFRTSSYVGFNSANAPDNASSVIIPQITLSNQGTFEFRRSLPYRYCELIFGSGQDIIGISGTAATPGSVDFFINPSRLDYVKSLFAGVSGGYTLTINAGGAGETLDGVCNATRTGGVAGAAVIGCQSFVTGSFASITNNVLKVNWININVFPAVTSPYFINTNPISTGIPSPLAAQSIYQAAATTEPLVMRVFFPTSYSDGKYYITMKYAGTPRRMWSNDGIIGGANGSLGVTVGSYLQLSGFGSAPYNQVNNRIFQVKNIFENAAGDPANRQPSGNANVQTIEVGTTFAVAPDGTNWGAGSAYTKNVSKLPLLHIKYI